MGVGLNSERPEMSHRVERSLPTSSLGRALFTWLYPGPARGYLFVVANTTAIAAMTLAALTVSGITGRGFGGWPAYDQVLYLMVVGWGYLIVYLGLGLLAVSAIRRVATVSMVGSILVQLLLLLAGAGIPWTVQMMSFRLRYLDYSYLQISNPFWTLYYLGEGGVPPDAPPIALMVSAAAICVLLLTLPGVVRELRRVRTALPARVAADELELHPLPPPEPTSPWDQPEK
jgi:hypothetical protein